MFQNVVPSWLVLLANDVVVEPSNSRSMPFASEVFIHMGLPGEFLVADRTVEVRVLDPLYLPSNLGSMLRSKGLLP